MDYKEHLDTLADELGATMNYIHGPMADDAEDPFMAFFLPAAGWDPFTRVATVPAPTTQAELVIGLHELGHAATLPDGLTPEDISFSEMTTWEARAHRWALANLPDELTSAGARRMEDAMGSYVRDLAFMEPDAEVPDEVTALLADLATVS